MSSNGVSTPFLLLVLPLSLLFWSPVSEARDFIRGDANYDHAVDLSDVIWTLDFLFHRGRIPASLDAADANDDAHVDLGDPAYLLNYLVRRGTPPPSPFPRPGADPTPDLLPQPPRIEIASPGFRDELTFSRQIRTSGVITDPDRHEISATLEVAGTVYRLDLSESGEFSMEVLLPEPPSGTAWQACDFVFRAEDSMGCYTVETRPVVYSRPYVGNEVIVKFKPGVGTEQIEAINSAVGASIAHHSEYLDLYRMEIPAGMDALEAVRYYRDQDNTVDFAHENKIFTVASTFPDDPYFAHVDPIEPQQHSLRDIHADAAWDQVTGAGNVVVALIDTGVDVSHPDLYENLWINEGELPADFKPGGRWELLDVDGDRVITFADLNTAPNDQAILAAAAEQGKLVDWNNNSRIDGEDLVSGVVRGSSPAPYNLPSVFEDQEDNDENGLVDDLIGWDFSTPAHPTRPWRDKWGRTHVTKESNLPYDYSGHGTAVAGIIGATGNNRRGVSGVAWKVRLMPLSACFGSYGTLDTVAIASALEYARSNGADIIHMSFYTFMNLSISSHYDVVINKLAEIEEENILAVCAAGNGFFGNEFYYGYYYRNDIEQVNLDDFPFPQYPATLPFSNILCVAACDRNGDLADFTFSYMSNYGPETVDLAAPGRAGDFNQWRILTTYPDHDEFHPTLESLRLRGPDFMHVPYGVFEGTSAAAPYATGVAALLLSQYPNLKATGLKNILMQSAEPTPGLEGKCVSGGRLRADAALQLAATYVNSEFVVTGPESERSWISIFDAHDHRGEPKEYWPRIRPFGENFNEGVSVACGDIDGDGFDEMFYGAGPTVNPTINVYRVRSNCTLEFMTQFEAFPYGAASELRAQHGVRIACADVNGDGTDEVYVAPWIRFGDYRPHIELWRWNEAAGRMELITAFEPFGSSYSVGMNIAGGDLDGDGDDEIIVGAGEGSVPLLHVFDTTWPQPFRQVAGWYVTGHRFRGGIRVGAADIDGNGRDEILAVNGRGGGPTLWVYEFPSLNLLHFIQGFTGNEHGIYVAGGDVTGDGREEVLIGAGAGYGPAVWVWSLVGHPGSLQLSQQFFVREQGFQGGVSLAAGVFPR